MCLHGIVIPATNAVVIAWNTRQGSVLKCKNKVTYHPCSFSATFQCCNLCFFFCCTSLAFILVLIVFICKLIGVQCDVLLLPWWFCYLSFCPKANLLKLCSVFDLRFPQNDDAFLVLRGCLSHHNSEFLVVFWLITVLGSLLRFCWLYYWVFGSVILLFCTF